MHFSQYGGQVKKEMMHFPWNFYVANKDEFSNWRLAILLGLFVTDTIFYLHIETTHLSNGKEEEKLQEI